MTIIKSERILPVDIDGTLLVWGKIPKGAKTVLFTDPYSGDQKLVRVHKANVKILKNHLVRGTIVLAWSSSGYQWAVAALKALGIDHDNIFVLSKPFSYLDDLNCKKWMGDQIYLDVDSDYGG